MKTRGKWAPSDAVAFRVVQPTQVSEHIFCHYCGRELTTFDFKTGNLHVGKHKVWIHRNGLQTRRCWRLDQCEERRKARQALRDIIE